MLVIEGLLKDSQVLLTVVGDGQAAVLAARSAEWDLILMDLRMPRLDGLAATRAIRSDERASGRSAVPVVALSASALATEIKACLNAGCNAYLSKPVDKARLLATLQAQLAGSPMLAVPTSQADADTAAAAAIEATATAPELPFMNQAAAQQRLGGDAQLYARLCQAAWPEFVGWEQRFEAAAADADAARCRRLAHDLKSVAAALGAERLAAAAAALEASLNEAAGAPSGVMTPLERPAVQPQKRPPQQPVPAALSAELQRVRQHLQASVPNPA